MTTRFEWTQKRTAAALALAQGRKREQVASEVGATRKTVYNWLQQPEFAAEVDRLSSMTDIAAKSERLRIAMRAVRQKVSDERIETDRDLLDWLRFAQGETQGLKIGLTKLAECESSGIVCRTLVTSQRVARFPPASRIKLK